MRSQFDQKFHLNPSLLPFGNSSSLPLEPGTYACRIHAEKGNLIFHHFTYDIYNGTWTGHTEPNEPETLVIHEGETKDFSFDCGTHYGYTDSISITNDSLLKGADFSCYCTQVPCAQ